MVLLGPGDIVGGEVGLLAVSCALYPWTRKDLKGEVCKGFTNRQNSLGRKGAGVGPA